ncbi:hypothetical protein [Limimaricola hongkongensis]|uniref:hypothetical protein n=1 Tax=Limimaricola hongkongensis TaxID=278132 RepID=UPI0013A57811|nr:hypothetical protein [Limimaricola hongkongensis]
MIERADLRRNRIDLYAAAVADGLASGALVSATTEAMLSSSMQAGHSKYCFACHRVVVSPGQKNLKHPDVSGQFGRELGALPVREWPHASRHVLETDQ